MTTAPLETPEQRADRLQRENDQLRRQDMAMGWFDRLWNSFNLFELLVICLVVGGLWFAAKANPDFVETLVEKLPDSWKATVSGALNWLGISVDLTKTLTNMPLDDFHTDVLGKMGIDKATAQQLVKTDAEKRSLVQFIADANAERNPDGSIKTKGNITTDTLASDKTLYALMTTPRYVPLVQAAARAGLQKGQDGKLSDKAEPMLAALRTIAKDEKRLTELFTTHREATLSLIRIVAPQTSEKEIEVLLKVGIQDGKATKTLSDVFTALLTPGADGKLPDPKNVIVAAMGQDPKLAEGVIDAFVAKLPTAQVDAFKALRAKIGDGNIQQLMKALDSSNKAQAVMGIVLRPDMIGALPQFIAVAKHEPGLAAQLPFRLESLQNFIQTTGFGADGKPNTALVTLLNSASSTGLDFAKLKEPLQTYIFSEEVAKNPNSLPALQTFVNTIDATKLAEADRKALDELKAVVNHLTQPALRALGALKKQGLEPEEVKARMADTQGNFTVSSALSALMVPDFRNSLKQAGIEKLAPLLAGLGSGFASSPKNAQALIKFLDKVQSSRGYTAAAIDSTQKVILAFAGLVDGKAPKEAFAGITPTQLANFFNNPDNHNAMMELLKRDNGTDRSKDALDTSMLDENGQKLVATLWRRLGDYKGWGFSNWLRTEQGAADFLKIVTSSEDELKKDFLSKSTTKEAIYADWFASKDEAMKSYLEKLSASTKQNAGSIIDIKHAIDPYLAAPAATPAAARGQASGAAASH